MFFRKKKKDKRVRLTVTKRTPDTQTFIIPQIEIEEEKIEIVPEPKKFERSTFHSPFFTNRGNDAEITIPDINQNIDDRNLQLDDFRTQRELTKEDRINLRGSEYHEFDIIEGHSLNEALDLQNKKTKVHLEKEDGEVYVPKKEEAPLPETTFNREEPKTSIEDFYVTREQIEDLKDENSFIDDFLKDSEFNEEDVEEETPVKDQVEDENETQPEEQISIKVTEKKIEKEYVLPPITLLNPSHKSDEDHTSWIQKQIEVLNRTFEEFKVGASVYKYTKGPTVTRYEITLESGVNVKKITNMQDNLKMALAAKDIRIEAPIPGKTTVGIEVPNLKKEIVHFIEIVDTEEFDKIDDPLAVALGLDIDGNGVYTSISKMPHGLVAGATGSGKSVCINTLLISLLFKYKPEELRMMLIDPKMVELTPYNDLPHLLTPVITDVKIATAGLKWAVEEMERRFLLFKDERVRDIATYNEKVINEGDSDIMPYIVIVIDELADLMAVASSSVEEAIMRLTQKARACGMHMIIATQRPSTDVVKGTIKSNIPTRIAFMVSSYVDSMTIIDSAGADKLLGKGDMLFAESGKPNIRVQGAYISDDEIYSVTDYIREQRDPNYQFTQEKLIKKATIALEADEKLPDIARYVVLMGECSINKISKEFKVGFNRAQNVVETLAEMGIVSDNLGSKARQVLVDEEELEKILN